MEGGLSPPRMGAGPGGCVVDRAIAPLHGGPYGGGQPVHIYAEAAQELRRRPVVLAEQAQKDMLRADVFLVEAKGFLLSEAEGGLRVRGQPVEAVSHRGHRIPQTIPRAA